MLFFFFFSSRRRHTRLVSDWSSDVCSSDLMHPLIPDEWSLRSADDDTELRAVSFRELTGVRAVEVTEQIGLQNLVYSFGTMHPGAIELHNFPRFLQDFERQDGKLQDLAA